MGSLYILDVTTAKTPDFRFVWTTKESGFLGYKLPDQRNFTVFCWRPPYTCTYL